MIRHVVLLTWAAEATGEQKQALADELRALAPQMSGLTAYNVGPDARIVDGNADFAIVADFDDVASYLAYREHPAHRAVIDQFVLPIAQQRVSVQYEI
jgi:ABC-type sulfate transport system substrate-binding protein